jgi:hypothetical protein
MDECACLYGGFDDDDDTGFTATSVLTARKVHECYECHQVIQVGERYQRVVQKYEGKIYAYKHCLLCVEIQNALYCDGGWLWGCLWSDIREQIFEGTGLTIACLDKLTTAAAKEKLQRAWKDYVHG